MSTGAFNMKDREEPEQISFAVGEIIEGELVSIDKVKLKSGDIVSSYELRDLESGKYVRFLGSYDLNKKLRPTDVGYYVEVRYEGEDKSISRNGNALKRFKVRVSDVPVKAAMKNQLEDGTYITDNDFPDNMR